MIQHDAGKSVSTLICVPRGEVMFACIYVPDFPMQAIVRTEPLLRDRAVAVLDGRPPLVHVIALNEKARRLGMETGMTKIQAGVFTTLEEKNLAALRQRSPAQENSAHSALLELAHASTPRVEDTAADTLLLDLSGMKRLYGAPVRVTCELVRRANGVGLDANVALAVNPDAAMHAARGFKGITVIPAGKEARQLWGLPLPVLLEAFELSPANTLADGRKRGKLREQILDTLERWGVRDFQALAMLPDHALAARLGETGTHIQRLARGACMRTLVLGQPSLCFEEMMEFEFPVETLEPLSFILNRLLEQLSARLEAQTLAVQELHLRLQLERRVADEETATVQELTGNSDNARSAIFELFLRLPVAIRDAKVLLKLLQLELAAHSPGAPVTKVWITAKPAPPRSAQRGLFLPISPEPERLEITLARISSVVGEHRAGIAHLLDSHRPDSFRMDRFMAAAEGSKLVKHPTLSASERTSRLALRSFRPPRLLQVCLSEGRPVRLTVVAKHKNRSKLQGNILWSAGPWRSSGNWWTENIHEESADKDRGSWDRDEWDVALAENDGGVTLYRIYRDLQSGQWFADASYD